MKKVKYITAAFSVLFTLLAAAVKLIEEKTKYNFLIGTLSGDGLISVLLICAAACLAVSAITAFASKREKHIVINTVIRIILIAVTVYYTLILSLFTTDTEYYKFTSPDGKHSVIAEEWSFLLGGGVNFYERENVFFVKEKGSFSTDDGYRVIAAENYSVEWNENVFTFSGSNGNGVYDTIEIKLSE